MNETLRGARAFASVLTDTQREVQSGIEIVVPNGRYTIEAQFHDGSVQTLEAQVDHSTGRSTTVEITAP